jgi:hypothetical protein
MISRIAFAGLLKPIFGVSVFMAIGCVAAAQSVPLSEVEIRMMRTPHGGCARPCSRYEVTVRGDGTVTEGRRSDSSERQPED